MADIELVVKIPEGLKKDFELEQWTALSCMEMKDALINGTPLPKGHGRLIDADELEEIFGEKCVGDCGACGACMTKRKTDGRGKWYDTCSMIDNAPTIIEAESEG